MRFAAVACFGWLALCAVPAQSAVLQAQIPPIPLPAVTASGIRIDGAFRTAAIAVDGATVLQIAEDANAPASRFPLATRAADVDATIEALLAPGAGEGRATVYDPASLRVHVARQGDVASLEAVDAHHPDPLPIVTVTTSDARYAETTVSALSAQWRSRLQAALVRALSIRQPAMQRRSERAVVRVAATLTLATLVLLALRYTLRRRVLRLEGEVAEDERRTGEERAAQASEPAQGGSRRRRYLASALRSARPAQRLRFARALAETILWAIALAWAIAATWAFSLFPQTTPLSRTIVRDLFVVASTVVATGLLDRAADVLIARLAGAWGTHGPGDAEERARRALRVPTIASAAAGFKRFVLVFVAVLVVLGEIGVPTGSVVTIGGLAAIALSLAAQSFVRDFLNGFLVLFEDHYVVGDFVAIGAFSGMVERLTLRMVQIRNVSGDLVTLPHSTVTSVVNRSRDWSRVDYRVPVEPKADLGRALAIVRDVIEGLARDDAWHADILEPVEWIGLDELTRDAAIVRVSVRTAPLRQFALRREINARVEAEFARAEIAFGNPPPAWSS